jgi:probable F420-dependent oxidoreductase
VTFEGDYYSVTDASVGFLPDPPMDLWLGGRAPAAMARIGRLADGWLASFLTPGEAADGIATINEAASGVGRAVDQEHFGVSLPVVFGSVPEQMSEAIRTRRPDLDPAELVPIGWAGLEQLVASFVDAGVSKFVVRPVTPPDSWERWVEDFAAFAVPLQT